MNIKDTYNANKERILTGLVLLGVAILIAIIDNFFVTWSILGICYIFAFYEAMNLFNIKNDKFFIYAVALWIAAAFYPNPTDLIFIVIIAIISIKTHKKELNYRTLMPFLYPSISMLFLFTLYVDYGMETFIWLVVVVASTDTAAYFVGKGMGKTPFSPTSPNKTWEGVVGGISIATIAGTLIGSISHSIALAIFTSLVVSAASVWGDLFESYLKREAGVKDSGNIFPGHGGFLDRLDGYLFGVVIMVIILRGIA